MPRGAWASLGEVNVGLTVWIHLARPTIMQVT